MAQANPACRETHIPFTYPSPSVLFHHHSILRFLPPPHSIRLLPCTPLPHNPIPPSPGPQALQRSHWHLPHACIGSVVLKCKAEVQSGALLLRQELRPPRKQRLGRM
jgi:hypothetical protein